MKNKQLRLVTLAALFAALIMLMTAYVLHIPTGLNDGYIHLGDTMIYVAASMLPLPYAMAAAGIGGALADILSGAMLWAPFTAVIKALMVLPFTCRNERILCRRNGIAVVLAGLIGIAGYFMTAAILYDPAAAVTEILPNLIQESAGGALYLVLALVFDRAGLKSRLQKMV